MNDIVKLIGAMETAETETQSPLPEAITRFCDSIDRNFASTASRLRATAKMMHAVAADMENRADQLDGAAPEVSKQVHDWVSFERNASEREKHYAPLFGRKAPGA